MSSLRVVAFLAPAFVLGLTGAPAFARVTVVTGREDLPRKIADLPLIAGPITSPLADAEDYFAPREAVILPRIFSEDSMFAESPTLLSDVLERAAAEELRPGSAPRDGEVREARDTGSKPDVTGHASPRTPEGTSRGRMWMASMSLLGSFALLSFSGRAKFFSRGRRKT